MELGDAVITNPFSHRPLDRAIDDSIAMPEDERRQRMKALRHAVDFMDIKEWKPIGLQSGAATTFAAE